MKILLLACALLLIISCSRSLPKEILPPDKMQTIVFDLLKADEFINNYAIRDSSINIKTRRIELYEQVFVIHKTSREEFYKSYKYYERNPDKHKVLFDSLFSLANKNRIEAIDSNKTRPHIITAPR